MAPAGGRKVRAHHTSFISLLHFYFISEWIYYSFSLVSRIRERDVKEEQLVVLVSVTSMRSRLKACFSA